MAVGGLAGDGQGATTRSWTHSHGDLEAHDDVLGLFGLHRRDESFHHKARVVDLEVQESSVNKSRSRSSFTSRSVSGGAGRLPAATPPLTVLSEQFRTLGYLEREGGALLEDIFKGDIEAATRLDVKWTLSLWGNAGPTEDKGVAAAVF